MGEIYKVVWTKKVAKELNRLPPAIEMKFYAWISLIQLIGVREVRKYPGFHDEPLKGSLAGKRSVRLNQAYRAIYLERTDGEIEIIEVIGVNKHDY